MKFNIGDRVRLIGNLRGNSTVYNSVQANSFVGHEGKVVEIRLIRGECIYTVDFTTAFSWYEDELVLIPPKKTIKKLMFESRWVIPENSMDNHLIMKINEIIDYINERS